MCDDRNSSVGWIGVVQGPIHDEDMLRVRDVILEAHERDHILLRLQRWPWVRGRLLTRPIGVKRRVRQVGMYTLWAQQSTEQFISYQSNSYRIHSSVLRRNFIPDCPMKTLEDDYLFNLLKLRIHEAASFGSESDSCILSFWTTNNFVVLFRLWSLLLLLLSLFYMHLHSCIDS